MLMATLFQKYQKNSGIPFEVKYLVMNPGYNQKNLDCIRNNLTRLKINAEILETNIFEIASLQEKNPCYLCAKMRRGALYTLASKFNCNKIALGHHYDDVIETTLMNMLNVGSFQTMLPKLHSSNHKGMELIRPLYLIREKDILSWKEQNNLEFIQCACKLTETYQITNAGSQRFATKQLIKDLSKYDPNIEQNIFDSASNIDLDNILGYKIKEDN